MNFVPITVIRVCVGIIIIFWVSACGNAQQEQQMPPPPAVTVSEPLIEEVAEWKEFVGRFRAVERVEVRARVSGYLDKINFEDGQYVEKGDVLFVIDQRPFRIALNEAKASLESIQTRAELSEKEFGRAKNLKASGAVSQELLDRRQQEFHSARAELAAAQAAVEAAELELEFTEVRAPVSGRISENFISVGNLISGGMQAATLLTRIVSLDPIYFSFEASGEDLSPYLEQQSEEPSIPIYVKLTGEEDFVHEGVFDFIDNEIDQSTGTLSGRATFENSDLSLTPGMFGLARFAGNNSRPEIMIPDDAISSDQSTKFVFVVDDSNKVERRLVEIGFLHSNLRVIRRGLSENDRVIINGIQKAMPGQPVTPEEGEITIATREN